MKHSRNSGRKEALTVTFAFLSMVLLAAQTMTSMSIQASSQPSADNTTSSLVSVRRAKRLRLPIEQKASSSTAVIKDVIRPGIRAIRNAAPVTKALVRPTVILEKAGCGDGLVIAPEACDDGNKTSSDGCSGACIYESGFTCNRYSQPTVCTYVCGDGKIATGHETCDDGNTGNSDGCNQYCKKEPGYTCTTAEPNICTVIPICGNQWMESTEACDDGNTRSGDGCSTTCTLE